MGVDPGKCVWAVSLSVYLAEEVRGETVAYVLGGRVISLVAEGGGRVTIQKQHACAHAHIPALTVRRRRPLESSMMLSERSSAAVVSDLRAG